MSKSSHCNRICLWSGPRNVSTAMMYSFAQRDDTVVYDEPFYGYYLDKKLETFPIIFLLGLFTGLILGFYQLILILNYLTAILMKIYLMS